MSWFRNLFKKKVTNSISKSVLKNTKQKFSLTDFLESRILEDNLAIDFSKTSQFPMTKIGDGNKYQFDLNGTQIAYSKLSDDGTAGKIGDSRFQIIATWDTNLDLKLAHNRGVICTNNNNILILPLFFTIIFYGPLNVFVCSTHTNNKEDQLNGIYDLYYFDLKGRYIERLKGHYQAPPKFAFLNDDSQKVLAINYPEGYRLSEIVNYNLYIICKDKHLGFTDISGQILLGCYYKKIIVNESHSYAFIEKDQKLFKLDLKTFDQESLDVHGISIMKKDLIKVYVEDESGTLQYGIINDKGETILNVTFDYIDFNYSNHRFKVFSGEYNWVWDAKRDDIFEEHISPQSWKGDNFHGILRNGKWGIVDGDNKMILDYVYDWIEELSEEFYLLNQGGELYSYYNGDDKIDELAIVGGKWNLCDKNGKVLHEEYVLNPEDLNFDLNVRQPKEFYERTDIKAMRVNSPK